MLPRHRGEHEYELGGLGRDDSLILSLPPPRSVFRAYTGLPEGISSSTIFIIIIFTLGMAVITIALYLNYQPCQRNSRKRTHRQKEQSKSEESQFSDIQIEECHAHLC